MEVDQAQKVLKRACMNYTEFSKLVGVKPVTVRLAFSGKRLSKKMVGLLEAMESEQGDEDAKEERASIKEGMIKQTMGDVRLAKVYMLPANPYLRFIEFDDGTHGKFRTKTGAVGLVSWVKVKRAVEELVSMEGEYDGKDRLI